MLTPTIFLDVNDPIVHLCETLAAQAHDGQLRKFMDASDPLAAYINHPRRVAALVHAASGDADLVAAAFLHDVLEDTPVTADDLRDAGVPERIIAVVETLTKRQGENYTDFLARVCTDPDAWIIKRADIIDNLSTLPTDGERLSKKYVQALDYMVHHDPRPTP